jgi:lipopolysaccharide/colanic/teichoic acid biosynthesis glycosyltransferase
MSFLPPRRFHRFYEQILLSRGLSFLLGWALTVAAPVIAYWNVDGLFNPDPGQQTAVAVTSAAFALSYFVVKRLLTTYPGGQSAIFVGPQVLVIYMLAALVILFLRVDVSRFLLISSGAAALIWFYVEYLLMFRYRRPKLAILSGGLASELLTLADIDAREIIDFDMQGKRYDGVVADFDALTSEGERFLATCALQRIAVYNAKALYESFTGRVRIDRMSENNIGSLLPSPWFERTKTIMDWSMVVLSLPLVIPICAVTALLIKWESPGPIIYTQTRIGLGNKPFTIYKFRSMRVEDAAPEQFAGTDDPRITKVGKAIRKFRIDELPQLWNILKGDMSLIGPRPEQPSFVEHFSEKIPFYSYRHTVKPGITGWAQVRHGYAADADETQVKIEHDFYYIKNCSISLDLFILFLTVRTILTGFGSR